jgi:hypothetical protein
MTSQSIHLSSGSLDMTLAAVDNRLHLQTLSAAGHSWLHPSLASELFAVTVSGQLLTAANMLFDHAREEPGPEGIRHWVLSFNQAGLLVEQHMLVYAICG